MTEQNKVLFTLLPTHQGDNIGVATLNKPQALNALDGDMVALLIPQLLAWQGDKSVCMVVLHSDLDKAFCAGGDVVAMHNAIVTEASQEAPQALQDFFREEYRLDYLIHTYIKPILVWGHGIVMGGGLGLMAGGSHRIVTENSRIAMPEVSIGLYPDVGGSYFLNRMPLGSGLFLGLTGANINATDALYCQLADYFMPQDNKQRLFDKLVAADWQGQSPANHHILDAICLNLQDKHLLPLGHLEAQQPMLTQLASFSDVSTTVNHILALESADDQWLARAQKTLAAGSPISMHLVFEQLQQGATLSLADCFRMELAMSCRCGEVGEFQEGVRALLVDKDHQPHWLYSNVEEVPANVIASFFASRWVTQEHPLANFNLNFSPSLTAEGLKNN